MKAYIDQLLSLKVYRTILNPLIYTFLISGLVLMACEDKTTQIAMSNPEAGSEQEANILEAAGSEQEINIAEEAGSEQEATSGEEVDSEEEADRRKQKL